MSAHVHLSVPGNMKCKIHTCISATRLERPQLAQTYMQIQISCCIAQEVTFFFRCCDCLQDYTNLPGHFSQNQGLSMFVILYMFLYVMNIKTCFLSKSPDFHHISGQGTWPCHRTCWIVQHCHISSTVHASVVQACHIVVPSRLCAMLNPLGPQ